MAPVLRVFTGGYVVGLIIVGGLIIVDWGYELSRLLFIEHLKNGKEHNIFSTCDRLPQYRYRASSNHFQFSGHSL